MVESTSTKFWDELSSHSPLFESAQSAVLSELDIQYTIIEQFNINIYQLDLSWVGRRDNLI